MTEPVDLEAALVRQRDAVLVQMTHGRHCQPPDVCVCESGQALGALIALARAVGRGKALEDALDEADCEKPQVVWHDKIERMSDEARAEAERLARQVGG